MNQGYYNSLPEANHQMRGEVTRQINTKLNQEISANQDAKNSLSLLSNIFAHSDFNQLISQETRLSSLENLKTLSSLVASLNPQKDLIPALSNQLTNLVPQLDSRTTQASHTKNQQIKKLNYDDFSKFYSSDRFTKDKKTQLFNLNNFFQITDSNGDTFLFYENKNNRQTRGMWKYSGKPGDKKTFRVFNHKPIAPNDVLLKAIS
jgi:hypothetical protein